MSRVDVLAAIKAAALALPVSRELRPIHHALCDAGEAAVNLIKALRRAEEMLRIAGPLVAKFAAESEVFYDGADCDGTCIAEDCEHAAEDAAEALAKAQP